MQNRRLAREVALKSLYSTEIGQNKPADVIKHLLKLQLSEDPETLKFSEKLFITTFNHTKELDEIIDNQIKNWDVNRLAVIDKLLLRMAIAEFLFFDDIPTKVSINEAIDIAKRYSTRKSGTFVNGILDAALNKLNEEGRINKSGRGLIGTSASKKK